MRLFDFAFRGGMVYALKWVSVSFAIASFGLQAATVSIACGASGSDVKFCQQHAEAWAKKSGHSVKFFSPPGNPTEALALYRQLFAAKSSDVDVLIMDIIWPGILRDHLLDFTKHAADITKQHFPSIVANNTVDGKIMGVPWYTDAGLMYYRKDLLDKYKLKVPTTWEEFATSAKTIQEGERKAGTADFQGFVFQGKAYEGLTCNALEWIASFGGGSLIDDKGNVTVNNPEAARALNTVASWVGTIAPKGVLNYTEEESRGVFQTGKAAFMRNWPYAYALSQKADSPIKDKVGVAPLPKAVNSKTGAATLGGWQMAVSKYSKAPDAAVDLALYMTSAAVQKDRAIEGSFNPTRPDTYRDVDVVKANPFMASLADVFASSVARPTTVTGLKYPEVSQAVWDSAHEVLSGKSKAEDSLKRLEQKLGRIKRGKW